MLGCQWLKQRLMHRGRTACAAPIAEHPVGGHAMPTAIEIAIDDLTLTAELNDSATAAELAGCLPTEVRLSRWGDEYYGGCGINAPQADDAKEAMSVGELAFWPPGRALCIFFGPTPASVGDEPRAASPVNPIGWLTCDPAPLKALGYAVTATLRVAAE